MAFRIAPFLGEIPRIEPRNLPPGGAVIAKDCRIETGALQPMFEPVQVAKFTDEKQTIYRASDGTWLAWDADVDVSPGPIAEDRLYITGDGEPRLRLVEGGTRSLALPPPNNRPIATFLTSLREYLTVGNRNVRLTNGATYKTDTGVTAVVTISGSTATLNLTHPTGITPAAAAALINGLAYSNTTTGTIAPSLKKVSVTSLKDSGGNQFDADRNPTGTDTRQLDSIISKVFVGGTALDEELDGPPPLDSSDTAAQNDPPTLVATPLHPTYATASAPPVAVFSGAVVNTIEAGQTIRAITIQVENLSNGAVDPELSQTILYTYTHVTDLDEESAPAPLSRPLLWSPGQAVRISSFSTGSLSRGVNRYRIYRSQTAPGGATDLYFIAEVPRLTATFVDEVDANVMAEPIPSIDFDPPVSNLRGIVALPNGMMAAFVDKRLYFCEPYRPHAWPAKYALTLPYRIIGLAALGSSLAILTTGKPYIAQGTAPENMREQVIEAAPPCASKQSIVALGYGVAYASPDGLVLIDPNGAARTVSDQIFTGRQWKSLMNPGSFTAGRLDIFYALSYDPDSGPRRMVLIDLSGQTPFIIHTRDAPVNFHMDEGRQELFFLDSDKRTIKEYDPDMAGAGLRAYTWRSRLFSDIGYTNLGAMMIESDEKSSRPITVRLFGDGKLRAEITTPNRIVSLPSGYRARQWQVEITGTRRVNSVIVAHTAPEITRMG